MAVVDEMGTLSMITSSDLEKDIVDTQCKEDALFANKTTIHDLPQEIMLIIFSYLKVENLSKVGRVCKVWYSIAHDPFLWHELSFCGSKVPFAEVIRLLRKSPYLRSLQIIERIDASAILSEVFRVNNNIEELIVKRCYGALNLTVLNILVTHCPLIHTLAFKDSQFQNRGIYFLLQLLPRLRSLNLGYNHYFELEDLLTITSTCQNLEEIKILGSNMFYDKYLMGRNKVFVHICETVRDRLKVLKLNATGLTDEGLHAITQCIHLRSLHAHNLLHVTEEGLVSLHKLKQLKSLLVSKGQRINSEGWRALFQSDSFSNMESLLLTRNRFLDDSAMYHIYRHCHRIRKVSLRSCISVTDVGVGYLVRRCRRIVYLNVDGTHPNVGLSLLQIPLHLPHIQKLVVGDYVTEYRQSIVDHLGRALPELVILSVDVSKRETYWKKLFSEWGMGWVSYTG